MAFQLKTIELTTKVVICKQLNLPICCLAKEKGEKIIIFWVGHDDWH